jgi:hypothetical protein
VNLSQSKGHSNGAEKAEDGDAESTSGTIIVVVVAVVIVVVVVVVVTAVVIVVVVAIVIAVIILDQLATVGIGGRVALARELRGSLLVIIECVIVVGVDDTDHAFGALGVLRRVEGDGVGAVDGDTEDVVLWASELAKAVDLDLDRIRFTYGAVIGLDKAGEEAASQVAGCAGKVVETRGNRVVAAVEVELDDIALGSLDSIWVEGVIAGGDFDGLCTGDRGQDGTREH